MADSSTDLLERAKSGDVDAFAELFEDIRSTLFSVACRLVGPVDADDVVMETYLKAWRAIPRFGGRSSLRTWLYRIAHNCALDQIRGKQRRKESTVLSDEEDNRLERIPDERSDRPDEAAEKTELVRQVKDALAKLSHDHAVTLRLRYTDGLSYAEIAAATGVSLGTVMSRLFNAKRKLRSIVEHE